MASYPVIQRFFSFVSIPSLTDCWLWQGVVTTQNKRYGRFTLNRQKHLAHRISWVMWNKQDIPEDMFVLHRCDIPSCVNPAHLFLGTLSDNALDRESKGRGHKCSPKGEDHWRSRLSIEDVLAIRAAETTGNELAQQYGVSRGQIYAIRGGRAWQHLS